MSGPFRRSIALTLVLPLMAGACNAAHDDASAAMVIKTDPQSIADGRKIAEAQCSNCHALDQDAKIRPQDAPPLRYLLAQYNPDTLSQDFQNGIHVGHEMMPDFVFGPLGAEVVLAYIVSIQEEPPKAEAAPE